MGFSLKQALTPPKSIRKFQLKKLGNADWWKDFAGDIAVPAAVTLGGAGLLGLGPLSGLLGGAGSAIGGAAQGVAGAAGTAAKSGGILSTVGKFLGGADGREGFGLGDLARLIPAGIGGYQAIKGTQQAGRDQKTARGYANQAADSYLKAMQSAQDRWNQQSPLRDAFMSGVFQFSDPTNPFSRNIFEGFGPGSSNAPEDQGSTGKQEGGRKAKPKNDPRPVNRKASVKSGRGGGSVMDRMFDRTDRDENDREWRVR